MGVFDSDGPLSRRRAISLFLFFIKKYPSERSIEKAFDGVVSLYRVVASS